jgi:hypothetical protein
MSQVGLRSVGGLVSGNAPVSDFPVPIPVHWPTYHSLFRLDERNGDDPSIEDPVPKLSRLEFCYALEN